MSTRSRIGYELEDGRIRSTYCHSDGYPSYTGRKLLEHYDGEDEPEKARALVDIGYLSIVEPTLAGCRAIAANKGRPSTHANLDAFFQATKDSDGEWAYYLQNDGQWIGTKVVGCAEPNWLQLHDMVERFRKA